jgi:AGZA family xanthine/uracil permease-like MFS transporter
VPVTAFLDRRFALTAHGTTVGTEVLAGATTFVTMAYIVFVQPTVLGAAGMDPGAVMTATCLSTAFASLLMGLLANYPVAVAPAMGHNFFFAYGVVTAMHVPWPIALGSVAIAGAVFVVTAGFGVRERLITVLPETLKHAIVAGIGLLVATIGLQWAGIIVDSPGTLVTLGDLHRAPVLVALFGVGVTAIFMSRRIPGALLGGVLLTTIAGLMVGVIQYQGVASLPPSLAPTFLKLDIVGALTPAMAPVVLVFFLLALFDSVGTLVGIGTRAGLMRQGVLPRARQALLADAVGTVAGAALGTSTVTAYVESGAGVNAGGRTGLTALVTATLFLLALFFSPLVRMIGAGYAAGTATLYPVIAPPLILVGAMMAGSLRDIAWDDPAEAIPAFLTVVVTPLTMSITEGVAFGLLAFVVLRLATGRGRSVPPLVYACAGLFAARYAFLR